MEVVSMAALIALAAKFVDFFKYVTSGHWREAITQITVWVSGVIVILLAAQADITQSLAPVPGVTLGSINFASQLFIGLSIGSLGSFAYDYKKARDNTDSAVVPPLGGT